jgi:2-polyprenyl-3-methyl-5-hydroxy-6-metoxy-1,4-benzoquinol methylase
MKTWNDDAFYWKGLDSPQQAPRYREIASVIAEMCPDGSVLDVGCGEGLLRGFLERETAYFGIEGSPAASESARRGEDAILQCTAEEFSGGGRKWGCVVFNEMLYYTKNPCGLLRKYAGYLQPGGAVIFSIYQRQERFHRLAKVVHWLDRRRPYSNVHCTGMVLDMMRREGWTIERDKIVNKPDHPTPWRIVAARPGR